MDANIQYEISQKRRVTSSLKMILIVHLQGPQKNTVRSDCREWKKRLSFNQNKNTVCLLTAFIYKLPFIL